MSDIEPTPPAPQPEPAPEPAPEPESEAISVDPTLAGAGATTEVLPSSAGIPAPSAPEPDPRIADLEQQNLALRSQVADLTAQLAAPGQNPSDVPTAPTSPPVAPSAAAPVPFVQSGFDPQARVEELLRQGVPENDAVAQAAYEQRLWNDRQQPA